MGLYRGKNFAPFNNYIVSASTSSANQVVVQPSAQSEGLPVGGGATDLLVYNATTGVAFITWGTTTQTATNAGVAVGPGAIMMFDMGIPATNVGVLLSTGSGSVYISIGIGT